MDFINELNSSSYSDLSDPDLTDTELEFIEKENFAKAAGVVPRHHGTFSRSHSLNMTKHNSLEQEAMEDMKFEYEHLSLQNEPHVVSNPKGWHWISSIQGEKLIRELGAWNKSILKFIYSRRGRINRGWNCERNEPTRR
jgi:hypothetical protein